MTKATTTGLIILIIWLLGSLAIYAMAKHDEASTQAYDAYDTCVHSEYGVSVASYYEEHGAMPECN